jgi:hypothetical protein
LVEAFSDSHLDKGGSGVGLISTFELRKAIVISQTNSERMDGVENVASGLTWGREAVGL